MISIVLLTYNAERYIKKLLDSLDSQTLKEFELIIIDSSSTDGTQEFLKARNIEFVEISSKDFNHGGTRNLGLRLAKNDIVVYLTQDALPYDEYSIENIVTVFEKDDNIAVSFGRQVPYKETDIFGTFARLYNYPEKSSIKDKNSISEFGVKTFFNSNSFASYRKSFLISINGFPEKIIMSEDAFVAARLILLGFKVAYVSEAKVWHSHSYSVGEEFRRYFDIGVAYSQNEWMIKEFNSSEGEGIKFFIAELKYLITLGEKKLIMLQIYRTFIKYLGYKLGGIAKWIPIFIKRKISMHKEYW